MGVEEVWPAAHLAEVLSRVTGDAEEARALAARLIAASAERASSSQ